jgi:hypothetical protein
VQSFVIGKHGVCSTRNRQVHEFLATDADVLVTVDSDAIPDLDGMKLLVDAIRRDDVDVAAGWSLMQCDAESGGVPNIFTAHDEKANGRFLDPGIAHGKPGLHEFKGGAVGAHCVAIKRRVLEAMKEKGIIWFEDEFHRDTSLGDKFGTRKSGHDLLFFRRAQELGFRCWLDNRVFWGHVKETDLRDAYRQITSLYDEIASFRHIAQLLREADGNAGWSAGPVFLMRMAYEAERLPEDEMCVECGSGLTTRILSRILPPERLVTLEHDAEWVARLRGAVNGSLRHAPLASRGEYDWYSAFSLPDDRRIGLVVCDGPPRKARGSRYGALPELMPRMADEYTVLLDDADSEQDIIGRWTKEYGPFKTRIMPDEPAGRSFAVLTGARHGLGTMVRGSNPADVAGDEHVHLHDRMGVAAHD